MAEQIEVEQEISVDFSDVEEKSFDPVPRGKYTTRVIEGEIRAGAKGPYLAISYVIEDYGDGSDYAGQRLWDNLSFSPKGLWKLKGMLLAAGMTKEELSKGPITVAPEDLLDVVLTVGVAIAPDQNGEPRNVIKRYYVAVNPVELEAVVAEEISAEDASTINAEDDDAVNGAFEHEMDKVVKTL